MPDLIPVKSSNISAIAYQEERELLTVQFATGAMFEYAGIPHDLYAGLLEASSVGKYFHRFIKPRALSATKVRPETPSGGKLLVDLIDPEEPHALAGAEDAIPDAELSEAPEDVDEEPEALGA